MDVEVLRRSGPRSHLFETQHSMTILRRRSYGVVGAVRWCASGVVGACGCASARKLVCLVLAGLRVDHVACYYLKHQTGHRSHFLYSLRPCALDACGRLEQSDGGQIYSRQIASFILVTNRKPSISAARVVSTYFIKRLA